MSLNKSVCADAIVAALKPTNEDLSGAAEATTKAYWEKICGVIFDHIKANAVVEVPNVQSGSDIKLGTIKL